MIGAALLILPMSEKTTARASAKHPTQLAPPHLFGKFLYLHNSQIWTSFWQLHRFGQHKRNTNESKQPFFSGRSFEFQAILLKRLCGRSISTGFRLSNLKPVVDPRLPNMLICKLSFEPTTPWTPVTVGDVSLPISHPRSGMILTEIHEHTQINASSMCKTGQILFLKLLCWAMLGRITGTSDIMWSYTWSVPLLLWQDLLILVLILHLARCGSVSRGRASTKSLAVPSNFFNFWEICKETKFREAPKTSFSPLWLPKRKCHLKKSPLRNNNSQLNTLSSFTSGNQIAAF